jgi:hypothetical protein
LLLTYVDAVGVFVAAVVTEVAGFFGLLVALDCYKFLSRKLFSMNC